jgi:hypothetical protein
LVRLGRQYDIREIDENLYLAVLDRRKAQDACAAGDLTDASIQDQGQGGADKGTEVG